MVRGLSIATALLGSLPVTALTNLLDDDGPTASAWGPADPGKKHRSRSKYKPHQGKRECARRCRQLGLE